MFENKNLPLAHNIKEAQELHVLLEAVKQETGYHMDPLALPRVTGSWNQNLTISAVLACLEHAALIGGSSSVKRDFLVNTLLQVAISSDSSRSSHHSVSFPSTTSCTRS